MFEIFWTAEAKNSYTSLKDDPAHLKQYKAAKKSIQLLAADLRHPGLRTHQYSSLKGPSEEKVFEAYAEQNTPTGYRIFWYYGHSRGTITIVSITPHP